MSPLQSPQSSPVLTLMSGGEVAVSGSWTVSAVQRMAFSTFRKISSPNNTIPNVAGEIRLDGRALRELDTAGAAVLLSQIQTSPHRQISLVNFSPAHIALLELLQDKFGQQNPIREKSKTFVEAVIEWEHSLFQSVARQLSFFGELLVSLARLIVRPKDVRVKELVIQVERVGVSAIPIISLVTFLIGLVVAFLFANQAARFGANIFIVDAVGVGVCRELSPVLVAILCAGRSGSAFTAQIGTMKLNEEVDAIRVMGLSPVNVLVIPRMLALMLMMPMLVLVGDLFGILGGVLIANNTLDITYATFFDRLQTVLPLRHVWIGLGKAPVFAFVIAFIGCRLGLSVENNARSVGLNTTTTVVKSIVAVILLNAAFAVIFQEMKW